MNKLTESLSVIAIVATIAASFYMYKFYQIIGVNIFNYLDASEILISQFQLLMNLGILSLLSFVSIIVFVSVTAHFFAPTEVENENQLSSLEDENKVEVATRAAKENTIDWFNIPGMSLNIFSGFVILTWIVLLICLFYSPIKFPVIKFAAITGTVGILIAKFNEFASKALYRLYRGKYFSNRPLADEVSMIIKQIVLIELFGMLLAVVNLSAEYNMQYIMLVSTHNNVVLELDNKIIKTNDTLVYVGRTRNFIFLFDKSKEESQIISSDKINRFTLSAGSKSVLFPKKYINPMYFKAKKAN